MSNQLSENILVGGWTGYHPLSADDKKVFSEALPTDVYHHVIYHPEKVATQVVNGINYRFECVASIPDGNVFWRAIVEIYLRPYLHGMPPPTPIVVGIIRQ